MGARARLNSLYALSGLVTAAVFGAAMGSWKVFFLVALVTIGLMFSDSRIRMFPVRQLRHISRWKSQRRQR